MSVPFSANFRRNSAPVRVALAAVLLAALLSCIAPGSDGSRDVAAGDGVSSLPPDGAGPGVPEPFPKGEMFTELFQHTAGAIGEDCDPCVSPDGKTLVFASTQHTVKYNLYAKAIDSRVLRQLTDDPGDERFPRFSPDGKLLAFAATKNGNWDIFIGNADQPKDAACVTLDSKDNEICPTWSPDGTRIAYCSFSSRSQQWELWLYDCRRKQRQHLGVGFMPAWHPKKEIIAFQKARQRDPNWYAIWTLDLSGNRLCEIVSHPDWAAVHPAWSTCGKYLAFATVGKWNAGGTSETSAEMKPDNIWVVCEDGSAPAQITSDSSSDSSPVWAVDGRIFFLSERSGFKNVWSIKPLLPELPEEE